MPLSVFTKISLIYLVRSIARMVSFALLLFLGIIVAGQGRPDIKAFTQAEKVSAVMFVTMIAGLVVGWFRELAGALLIAGGFLGFVVSEYASTGDAGMSGVFMLFPLAAALFFAYWLLARRR
jgi:hypothetical protein